MSRSAVISAPGTKPKVSIASRPNALQLGWKSQWKAHWAPRWRW
jgi:hypothetical protein